MWVGVEAIISRPSYARPEGCWEERIPKKSLKIGIPEREKVRYNDREIGITPLMRVI
jgi:hypothetical protein